MPGGQIILIKICQPMMTAGSRHDLHELDGGCKKIAQSLCCLLSSTGDISTLIGTRSLATNLRIGKLFMSAITKWLFTGAAAGTKVIVLSCFKIYSYWAIGSDNWLGHGVLLVQMGSFAPLSLARTEPTGQNFARLRVRRPRN
jgi:hypothetical protein